MTSERVNTNTDHGCFGCGDKNPIGLHLAFYRTDSGVAGNFTPATEHEGYMRMTHGGIVSTVLDEAMSWAVIDSGRLVVTAKMSVNFRKPIPSRTELLVSAEITRDRGRAVETRGELRDPDGSLLADASAVFIRVSEAQQAEWEATYLKTEDRPRSPS